MRNTYLALAVCSAFAALAGSSAFAGSLYDEPQVIPGMGPEVWQAEAYPPGANEMRWRQPNPYAAPRPAAAPRPSLGGGLLEAVLGGAPEGGPEPLAQPAYRRARVAYNTIEQQADPYAGAGYAVRPAKAVDPMFERQEVAYEGDQPVGTVVVDTRNKFLYLVEGQGRALRYGIGVGRPGFLWTGTKVITRKAEWPDWTPPSEMIKRRPDLPSHMEGGLANPLGARAMYLGSSLYRIHGTNEPDTIGTNVSSGCIRLTNGDVTDLFTRVKVGTHVVVL